MKKLFSLVLLLTVGLQSFSRDVGKFDKEYYLKKSRTQKTAGYALIGTGLGLIVIGGVVWTSGFSEGLSDVFDFSSNNPSAGEYEMNTGNVLAIIGTAAAVSSIPLFIAAGKNKKNAMSISFKLQSVPQLKEIYLTNFKTPSLTLKVQL